ncbi:V-type ATP synthase subunit F [Chloroflexota bacterium]
MMPVKHLSIAVIGDEDLVSGLRLAGVRRYFAIKAEDEGEEVRKALTELMNDPDIGIIVIQEDYMKYVDDLIPPFKQRKQVTPIILPVPSKYGTKYRDVTEYYKAYIRGFIGFEIEI